MASRGEQREAAREERRRREQEDAAAKRRRLQRIYVIGGLLAVGIITLVVVAAAGVGGGGSTKDLASLYPKASIAAPGQSLVLGPAAKAAGCSLLSHPGEDHDHTSDTVRYKTNPPSSGNHALGPASDGVFTQAPPIGNLVHALEHGRVIIWFKSSAAPAVRGKLKALFDQDPSLLILTPNETGMPYEVAATAWSGDRSTNGPEVGHVLGCPTADPKVLDALRSFIASYRGQGPERISQPE